MLAMADQEFHQQVYDHRLRELVWRTGDVCIATDSGVPRSTAAGWLRICPRPVISLDVFGMVHTDLEAEVVKLRRRIRILTSIVGLLVSLVRATGCRLDRVDVSDRKTRSVVLRAAERARKFLPTSSVLRILGISGSRYNAWLLTERGCGLSDEETCPRSIPSKLMPTEVCVIQEMVTDECYRHIPTGRLAVLAQRMGRVFASPSTWYRLARTRGWGRPRYRLHPSSPKTGVRASKPNELWHVDASAVRLVDGTKIWLHAVIDNFSRRILAWRVVERFEIASTVAVLKEALANAVSADGRPRLMVDGGNENFNGDVDDLVDRGLISRVRALADIQFSNSMIESWWSGLKHQWLFLHRLESAAAVRRLVEFYVPEYNETIPHSAFSGQTPDEVYFGRDDGVAAKLEAANEAARQRRLEANRAAWCNRCEDIQRPVLGWALA